MRIFFFLAFISWLCACSPVSRVSLTKKFKATEKKFQDHVGFALYDPGKKKTIFEYNSAKYFTPASNTKIFTLFASLKILGDSVPALHYEQREDSLIFWGTGDPSFLYKNVHHDSSVYNFLKSVETPLYFSVGNFHTPHFGAGWSWDDYNDYYSAERSPFPVYGNMFSVRLAGDTIFVSPRSFGKYMSIGEPKEGNQVVREIHSNNFKFHPGTQASRTSEWDVPMRIDYETIVQLLSDTLKRPVFPIKNIHDSTRIYVSQTLYGLPADSLYRVMMQDSDNFIAEHLLLMCADILSDSLQPEIAIRYVKENFLNDLPDEPQWVDGSGLSRYNLFTPRSIVALWRKIEDIIPREQLFPLLAIGGKKGTIRNWYKSEQPYIFGKTGSLSNNHCLSGYMITRSGKTLIFSFMSNNFVDSPNNIRSNMQEILYTIYDQY